ncbi:MAG: hypothetical protein KAZ30_02390 [Candidatus Magasanikbacteria bacterium]|nr:hypothetical protein [Candidatus Magasanikbacteria bacterium]
MSVNPPDSNKKTESVNLADLAARIDELEVLVRKNIQWSEVVRQDTKRIKRRLTVMAVGGWIRLFLILAPIIAAAIFFPPYYRQAKEWYTQNIQGPQQKMQGNVDAFLNFLPSSAPTVTKP